MGKIYLAPKGMDAPDLSKYPVEAGRIDTYFEDCEKFVEKVKKWAKANGDACKESGEEIRFQVADGYARYIVLSLKPVALIHLDVGDAWHYQYIHRLTAKDIREEISKQKAMVKLFSKKKAA